MSMEELIKKILREQETGIKKDYKFSEGGYLVPSDKVDAEISLTPEEYAKIKDMNDNMKELFLNHKEYLKELVKHNRGVIKHVINKIRE